MVSQILLCVMTSILLVAAPLIHAQQKPPEPEPRRAKTVPQQDRRSPAIVRYAGQIVSITIDNCGLQPGSCEGALVLTRREVAERVTLAIRGGTWLKRGDQLFVVDELEVGHDVVVEAEQIPGQEFPRIAILSLQFAAVAKEPPEPEPRRVETDPQQDRRNIAIARYAGQIVSITIDKCGLQPGTCVGWVFLGGREVAERVALAVRSETRMKRSDQFFVIEELGIGNYVEVEAVQIPGQNIMLITILQTPS